jgi:Ubiquitin-conjugating enzyme
MGSHRGKSRSAARRDKDPSLNSRIGEQLKDEDIFRWNVALIVLNPDSLYYGGYFKAVMDFPQNYPYSPPSKIYPRKIKTFTGTQSKRKVRANRIVSPLQNSDSADPYGTQIFTAAVICASPFSTLLARMSSLANSLLSAGLPLNAWNRS